MPNLSKLALALLRHGAAHTSLSLSAPLGNGGWEPVSLAGSRARGPFLTKQAQLGSCAEQKPGQSPVLLCSSHPCSAAAAAGDRQAAPLGVGLGSVGLSVGLGQGCLQPEGGS